MWTPLFTSRLCWLAGKPFSRTAEYFMYLRIAESGLTHQTTRIEVNRGAHVVLDSQSPILKQDAFVSVLTVPESGLVSMRRESAFFALVVDRIDPVATVCVFVFLSRACWCVVPVGTGTLYVVLISLFVFILEPALWIRLAGYGGTVRALDS